MGGARQGRDPIPRFRQYALDSSLLSEEQLQDIEKDVQREVEDAVQYADESPKPVCPLLLSLHPPACPTNHVHAHAHAYFML